MAEPERDDPPGEPESEEEFEARARRMTWGKGEEPQISQCIRCRWWKAGLPPTCAAFPQAIPDVMLRNQHDHRQPYPGDKGIRFEPKPAAPR